MWPAAAALTLHGAGLTVVMDEALARPLSIVYGSHNFSAVVAEPDGSAPHAAVADYAQDGAEPDSSAPLCMPILNVGCADQHGHGGGTDAPKFHSAAECCDRCEGLGDCTVRATNSDDAAMLPQLLIHFASGLDVERSEGEPVLLQLDGLRLHDAHALARLANVGRPVPSAEAAVPQPPAAAAARAGDADAVVAPVRDRAADEPQRAEPHVLRRRRRDDVHTRG